MMCIGVSIQVMKQYHELSSGSAHVHTSREIDEKRKVPCVLGLIKTEFATEATFSGYGHAHRHNVRIWVAESPLVYVEYQRNKASHSQVEHVKWPDAR
ncbi:hypothetical protein NPIL_544801 [Nephila pilipes]|uniref:Uncharacterized protein n=1 Tax=Nephila pilipes TaxID=299642 RepID=A0A8X6TV19_NEPPI|nr:hypothetical protein NPIL_544801 [Nephila pilipes]